MRVLKSTAIILSFLSFLIIASLAHILVTFLKPSRRWVVISRLTRLHIRSLQLIIGIKVTLEGSENLKTDKPYYIISRHIGYIDGVVLGGLFTGIFVSKREIKSWPLIGQVIGISGTIFIDRSRKDKLEHSLSVIEGRLKNGINIVLFPEGTSTDGTRLLAFQTAFFKPPISISIPVVPITISYKSVDNMQFDVSNKDTLYWYGDMDFFTHFWNLLQYRWINVTVTIHEPIDTSEYAGDSSGRKQLSQKCRDSIAQASGVPLNGTG